jgi:hypothetical protein
MVYEYLGPKMFAELIGETYRQLLREHASMAASGGSQRRQLSLS